MGDTLLSIDLASQTGQQAIVSAISSISDSLESLIESNNVKTTISNKVDTKAIINLSTTWSGEGPYTQVVSIPSASITSESKIDLQPDTTVINQLITDGVAAIWIQNNNGALTCYALGACTSVPMSIQCTISNARPFITNITIESEPTKKTYTVGDVLDLSGLEVIANYSDNTSADVTSDCICMPADGDILSDTGQKTVIIIYMDNGIPRILMFDISVVT